MRAPLTVLVLLLGLFPSVSASTHDEGWPKDEQDHSADGSPKEGVSPAEGESDQGPSGNTSAPKEGVADDALREGEKPSRRPPPEAGFDVSAPSGASCPDGNASGASCSPLTPWPGAPAAFPSQDPPGFTRGLGVGCGPVGSSQEASPLHWGRVTGRHVTFCVSPTTQMAVLRDYAVEGRRVLNYLQAPSFDWSRQGLQGTTFAAEGQMGVPGPYQDDTRLVVEAEDASSGTLTATCRPSNQFESILDTPFHYHRHFAEEYCTLMLAAPLWVLTSIDGIPTVDVRRPGEAFWAAVEPRAPAQPLSFWTLYGEQEGGHVTLYLGLPCLPDELAYPCEDTRGVHLNLAFFGADGAALPGPWTRPGWRTLAFEVPDGRSDAGLRAFVWTPADDWVAYIPNRGGTGHWVMFRGTLRVTAAFGSVAPVAPVPEDVRQHIVTALGGGGSAWLVDVHAGAQGLHAVPGVYGAPSESSAVPDLPVRSTAQGFAMRVEMPREAPPTLLLNVPWAVLPKAQRSGDGLDVQWQTDLSVGRDVARLRRVPLEELATGGEGGRYAAVVSEEALHLLIRPGAGGPAELMVTSGAGQEPRGVPFPYESLLAVVAVGALLGRRRRARGAPPAEGP